MRRLRCPVLPRPARVAAGAAALLAVVSGGLVGSSGSSGATPANPPRRALGAGLSIAVPPGWQVAFRLTGLAEPYERFTLASFRLSTPPRQARGCGPARAVAAIPADGALAFVLEYPTTGALSRPSFPPQPKRFALPPGPAQRYECFGSGWLLRFRAAGRSFQVMVALGRSAGRNQARLVAALSSLRVEGEPGSG
ncbi:MAG TPA: hypothetical protein VIJ51_10720 [Solirubrobacteraceae bacterium]